MLEQPYLDDVCKIGQGAVCCRYIVVGAKGMQYAKLTSLRRVIDRRVAQMNAKSDNCDGLPED